MDHFFPFHMSNNFKQPFSFLLSFFLCFSFSFYLAGLETDQRFLDMCDETGIVVWEGEPAFPIHATQICGEQEEEQEEPQEIGEQDEEEEDGGGAEGTGNKNM